MALNFHHGGFLLCCHKNLYWNIYIQCNADPNKRKKKGDGKKKGGEKETTDAAIISARTDSLMDEPVGPFPLVARNCFFEASFSPHSRRSTRLFY